MKRIGWSEHGIRLARKDRGFVQVLQAVLGQVDRDDQKFGSGDNSLLISSSELGIKVRPKRSKAGWILAVAPPKL